jgi:endonuclease/exonuclease/phosphatase (EEP) superfamily protein YafD
MRGVALLLSITVALALVVRVTVRDLNYPTSSVYYAFPWVVIAALAFAASLLWAGGQRRAWAGTLLSVSLISTLATWSTTFFSNPCLSDDDAIRVLFWNVDRGHGTWERIAEEIAVHDADIVALTEAGRSTTARRQFWHDRLPGYRIQLIDGGLILMSRSTLTDGTVTTLNGISRMYESALADDTLRIFVVDLDASPRFNKQNMIRTIFERANDGSGPTIVMGDFNAPTDARGFLEIRDRYHHAFESAGRGFATTWPAAVPLVAIDHIWLSRDITAHCTRIIKSDASDHRAIVTDIRLALPRKL